MLLILFVSMLSFIACTNNRESYYLNEKNDTVAYLLDCNDTILEAKLLCKKSKEQNPNIYEMLIDHFDLKEYKSVYIKEDVPNRLEYLYKNADFHLLLNGSADTIAYLSLKSLDVSLVRTSNVITSEDTLKMIKDNFGLSECDFYIQGNNSFLTLSNYASIDYSGNVEFKEWPIFYTYDNTRVMQYLYHIVDDLIGKNLYDEIDFLNHSLIIRYIGEYVRKNYFYGSWNATSNGKSIMERLKDGLEFQLLRVKYRRYLLDNMGEFGLYKVELKEDVKDVMKGETDHNLYLYSSEFDDYHYCQRVYDNREHIWRYLGINNVFFVGSSTTHQLKVYKVLEDEVIGTGEYGKQIDVEYLFKKIQDFYNPF